MSTTTITNNSSPYSWNNLMIKWWMLHIFSTTRTIYHSYYLYLIFQILYIIFFLIITSIIYYNIFCFFLILFNNFCFINCILNYYINFLISWKIIRLFYKSFCQDYQYKIFKDKLKKYFLQQFFF